MQELLNNAMGSRGIRHKNLVVAPGQGIVEFTGESISPVVRVLATGYEKNGKWSYSSWTVELTGVSVLEWTQDWGTGSWFKSNGLKGAVEELTAALPEGHGLSAAQVKRALRAIWPKTAATLAENDAAFLAAGDQFADLLVAQREYAAATAAAQQVVTEFEAAEEATRLRKQTDKLKAAAAAAKGGKMSLADLKAAMAG